MEVLTKACDVCGRQKQVANHWFIAVIDPAQKATGNVGIAFGPASAVIDNPQLFVVEDICGQQCAHKRLDRWFESQTVTSNQGVDLPIALRESDPNDTRN